MLEFQAVINIKVREEYTSEDKKREKQMESKGKASEQREKKAFDIVKQVPVLGWAYRGVRAGVYYAKGNKQEVKNSCNFDLSSELNIIKKGANIGKGIAACTTNYSKGIWIGRRPLGYSPVKITGIPNYSLEHWAVMINGRIYEVLGKSADET